MTVSKQVSLHGKRVFVTKDDQLAARNGFVAGGDDRPAIVLPGSPDTVAIFEDFFGDDVTGVDTGSPLYSGVFRAAIGDTGVGGAGAQNKQVGAGGVHRIFSGFGSSTLRAAAGGIGLSGGALDWKANSGPGGQSGRLRLGARLKMATVEQTEAAGSNRMHVFVGFTDVAGYEFPAYDTGAGLIGTADDFVGILFSPGGDTGWTGVSGRAGTDQVVALDTGVNANTYQTIEVEVHRGVSDTGGTATFYIDGIPRGSITSPVTSATALVPVAYAWLQDTGNNSVDIDYINVSAPRDTGL